MTVDRVMGAAGAALAAGFAPGSARASAATSTSSRTLSTAHTRTARTSAHVWKTNSPAPKLNSGAPRFHRPLPACLRGGNHARNDLRSPGRRAIRSPHRTDRPPRPAPSAASNHGAGHAKSPGTGRARRQSTERPYRRKPEQIKQTLAALVDRVEISADRRARPWFTFPAQRQTGPGHRWPGPVGHRFVWAHAKWRCRESNPGPLSPRQGFSVRSSLCLYLTPPIT
jgi:hypothetical protein